MFNKYQLMRHKINLGKSFNNKYLTYYQLKSIDVVINYHGNVKEAADYLKRSITTIHDHLSIVKQIYRFKNRHELLLFFGERKLKIENILKNIEGKLLFDFNFVDGEKKIRRNSDFQKMQGQLKNSDKYNMLETKRRKSMIEYSKENACIESKIKLKKNYFRPFIELPYF